MYKIGIDIGGMSVKAGLVDEKGNILKKATLVTPLNSNDNLAECIFSLIDSVSADAKMDKVDSIGIGSPGIINPNKGEITYASNLGVEHLDICSRVQNKYHKPCFVENDANCAVLGEYYFGNACGVNDVVMITLGTGVGTGFIVGGKMLVSPEGGGTEGGHMVVMVDGNMCNCGEKGCYETYASASALIEQTKAAMEIDKKSLLHKYAKIEGEVNGKVVFNAVKEGDLTAKLILEQYIKYVGSGIVSIVNIFRTPLVLIGGGLSQQEELLIKPLNKYVNEHVFGNKYLKPVDIKQAKLKNDAGILGAAMLGVN